MFILTGYFMANREMTWKKVCLRWVTTHRVLLFYAIGIVFLMIGINKCKVEIVGLSEVDSVWLIRMFFPFLNRTWYFMTDYLLVIFFSLFVNRSLRQLDKREYTILVLGLFFLLTIWTSLSRIDETKVVVGLSKVVENESGKCLYMFLFCYILGGFLQKYVPEKKWEKWVAIFIFAALWLMGLYGYWNWKWYLKVYNVGDSPFVIIQCVCLLLIFRSLHFHSGIVNWIAKNNMGVYLIHEHPLVRSIIWVQFPMLFTKEFYSGRWKYVIIICGICVMIYLVCNLIEALRGKLFCIIGSLISKAFGKKI